MTREQRIHILLAEDDPDDRLLTRRAIVESRMAATVTTVQDGEELLRYLRPEGDAGPPGPDASREEADRPPDLILLDLNMPRMDGREALREIKSDPELRRIPVVVLTTSEADQDVVQSYDLGVNAFITKPVTFSDLSAAMEALGAFWFDTAKLPPERDDTE